jgi:TRAP-type mannitol/chloroaromatic compound transport system substrate-binding protein
MSAFKEKAEEIIAEIITKDPKFAKIYTSFSEYKDTVEKWTKISEYALLKNRYE